MAKAVVLFSGGLDSSTCLALARQAGFSPHALAVRYGRSNPHNALGYLAHPRVSRALAKWLVTASDTAR